MASYNIKNGTDTVADFTIETIGLKKTICGISWCKITGTSKNGLKADDFKGKDISLVFCDGKKNESTIFSGFKVSSIETGKNVTIKMYSPEAVLAREKESKSYTAVNFASGIFEPTMKDAEITVAKSDNTIFGTIGDVNNEYMSAYLVQFNETKYDFLMRTTNRSGVPMYFEVEKEVGKEVGKMKLGGIGTEYSIEDTSKEDYNDVYFGNDDTIGNRDDKTYSTEITDNEFYESIEKGKYNEYSKEKETGDREWMVALRSLNEHSSLMDGALEAGVKVAQTVSAYHTNVNKENKKYDEDYFKNTTGQNARQYHIDATDKNKVSYTQFANYSKKSSDSRFSDGHYKSIRKVQQEMAKKCIWVRYKTSKEKYFLGDILKINSWGGEYIVVRVEMTASVKNNLWDNTWQYMLMAKCPYSIGTQSYVVTPAADLLAASERENTLLEKYEDMEIWDGSTYDEVRRFDGVQQATIEDNKDPKRLGRVRVKYGWQDGNSAATPWLKVLTPLATVNGGVCFVPQKGDKCLVGYRNGNIEQPYIAGATFTKEATPKWGARGCENIISCKNGHSIRFSTPKSFLSNISSAIPLLSILTDFIPGLVHAEAPDPSKDSGGAMSYIGGIDISDDACLYEISASSSSRNVTIASNLGKVGVNAFSAIDISAPVGDINITGKNVSIIAGNNLRIKAGEESGKDKDSVMSMIGAAIEPAIIEKVLFSDLVLDLRPIVALRNLLCKPNDGNMCFSSEQFITMEAGDGKVSLPSKDCTINNTSDREAKENIIFYIAMIVQEIDRIFEKSLLKVSVGEIKIKDAIGEISEFIWQNHDMSKGKKDLYSDIVEKLNTNQFPADVNTLVKDLGMDRIRPQRPSSSIKYYAKTGRVKSVYSHYQRLKEYVEMFRKKEFVTIEDTSNIDKMKKQCKDHVIDFSISKFIRYVNDSISQVTTVNDSISQQIKHINEIKFTVDAETITIKVQNPISVDRAEFVKCKRNCILNFIKSNNIIFKKNNNIINLENNLENNDENIVNNKKIDDIKEIRNDNDWNDLIKIFNNDNLSDSSWKNKKNSPYLDKLKETLIKNIAYDNIKEKWASPRVGGIYYSDEKNVTHKLGLNEASKNTPAELMKQILTTIR